MYRYTQTYVCRYTHTCAYFFTCVCTYIHVCMCGYVAISRHPTSPPPPEHRSVPQGGEET